MLKQLFFPGERGHQAQEHRQLQPPWEQRREEPLRPEAVQVQGDLQEQRGGRHGRSQRDTIQGGGEAGSHGESI